jgi:hypothetical protein
VVSSSPKASRSIKSRYAIDVALQHETRLSEYVRATQVKTSETLLTAIVVGGLILTQSVVAQGHKMGSVAVPGVESMEPASVEQGVLEQLIVERVVDQLTQLGGYASGVWRMHCGCEDRRYEGFGIEKRAKTEVMMGVRLET